MFEDGPVDRSDPHDASSQLSLYLLNLVSQPLTRIKKKLTDFLLKSIYDVFHSAEHIRKLIELKFFFSKAEHRPFRPKKARLLHKTQRPQSSPWLAALKGEDLRTSIYAFERPLDMLQETQHLWVKLGK